MRPPMGGLFRSRFCSHFPAVAAAPSAAAEREKVNELTLKPNPRPIHQTVLFLAVLLITAIIAVPASGVALAQSPPPDTDTITLVNKDRQMVERKKEGDFVARPIFSRQVGALYYSIRHPDTGEWLTSTMTRVHRRGRRSISGGWEYTFLYSVLGRRQRVRGPIPARPRARPTSSLLLASATAGLTASAHVPSMPWCRSTSPTGCGTGCCGALNPARWARAIAGWLIEGAHGTLCGVVQKNHR